MAFENISDKLNSVFKRLRGKGRLTKADVKEAMREVRMALLEADVSYKVVKDFTARVTERASGADVLEALSPAQQVIKIVNEELCTLLGGSNAKINISSKLPSVVMLCGLQGAGKTTNGAKLAGYLRKQGKRPLLVACDVYRPAAIKQLGESKISVRTSKDVSSIEICSVFGGGGHEMAAGCTISAGPARSKELLLAVVDEVMK